MANLLTDTAKSRLWELGSEADVVERIHRGLLEDGPGFQPAEAAWVTRRLAELLDWDIPEAPVQPTKG